MNKKIENRDIAIDTELNLFEGETSVTVKIAFKKNWPFLNVKETETLTFTYDRPFHMSQIHIKLLADQIGPSEKMKQQEIAYFNFG